MSARLNELIGRSMTWCVSLQRRARGDTAVRPWRTRRVEHLCRCIIAAPSGGSMNRREFVRLAGSGLSAGALTEAVVEAQITQSPAKSSTSTAKGSPKARMHVGTQQGD